MVLDAHVELTGPSGSRSIPVADLHRQPVDTPHIETVLKPGELITLIAVPLTELGRRSKYVKVRDRQSYEFALASAAVALALDGDRVSDVRIALGGLATVPWRAREAEAALKDQLLSEDTVQAAAEVAFAKAEAAGDNRFKIPLGKATLARALFETAGMEI
jgi:xanthine dehydrogenase YagS FAD-binding subunit